jgi:hypothetical protein
MPNVIITNWNPSTDPDPAPALRSLQPGEFFRFKSGSDELTYEYRGAGWYGLPGGYDGGPWHHYGNPFVVRMPAPCQFCGATNHSSADHAYMA